METLFEQVQEKILGRIAADSSKEKQNILVVDRFLNQALDIPLIEEIGAAFASLCRGCGIQKVMTIEASGIPIAYATAKALGVNALFAKKSLPLNAGKDLLRCEVFSYTKNKSYPLTLSARLLERDEKILVVDDFLARGEAMRSMIELVQAGGARVVAALAVIGKAYQGGEERIRALGIPVRCLIDLDEELNARPGPGTVFLRTANSEHE